MRKLASFVTKIEGGKSEAKHHHTLDIIKIIVCANSARTMPADVIQEYRAYHNKMEDKAAALRAKGLSPQQILDKLLGKKAKVRK